MLILAAILLSTLSLVWASEPIEYGYRDFSYPNGTGGNSEPTGEKPESKLWWNDGTWWGSLWSTAGNAYHIFRLDLATQSWVDTGTAIDDRSDSRADALWDGQHLYVVSHIFAKNDGGPAPAGQRGELYRYSYDSATKTYSLDAGFPVEVTGGESETLVVEKDSNGKLWVTYVEDQKVMVNRSLNGDDSQWGTPFQVPGSASVSSDDISSIITYNQHVGIMWSDQAGDDEMYFAVHPVGASDTTWTPVKAYGVSGDDHLSLKSLEADSEGNVYAAIKTSRSAELIVLLVCERNDNRCKQESDWSSYPVYDGTHSPTRPILLIDTSNRDLYVFTRNKDENNDSAIYYKWSDLDTIQFPVTSIGTPFIKSSADPNLNDPTSTKQNLTSVTGMVVLASDGDYYFHNYKSLSSSDTQYSLTVNTEGSGSVTLDPPGGVYDEGTSVTLTATADPGWAFSGWSGDLTGTENPATLTMDSDKTVTATFTAVPQYTLTTSTVGSGSVELDPAGGTYDEGTEVTLTATADSGWTFSGWSGDLTGTLNPATLTMDSNKAVTATFVSDHSLAVNVVGSGSVTLDPPGGTYPDGTLVTLTATASPGWRFGGWSGDLTGTENPATLTMDSDKTVTATFIRRHKLTVSTSGSGSVTLDPSGGVYDVGTTVTLTATADPGWNFSHWSGDLTGTANPATITMDEDKEVTANFSLPQYTLTVSVVGSGSVTLDPPGGVYDEGTIVSLSTAADPGWTFSGWSGDLSGDNDPATIRMDSDKQVMATFVQKEPGIQIEAYASTDSAMVGEVVTYTYVVANIGEATLDDVTARDDHLGLVPLGTSSLSSGQAVMATLPYTVTESDFPGPLANTVVVTGTAPTGDVVTDRATVTITVSSAGYNFYLTIVFSPGEAGESSRIYGQRADGEHRSAFQYVLTNYSVSRHRVNDGLAPSSSSPQKGAAVQLRRMP